MNMPPDTMGPPMGVHAALKQRLSTASPFGNPVLNSPSMEDMMPAVTGETSEGSQFLDRDSATNMNPYPEDQGDQSSPQVNQNGGAAPLNPEGEEFLPEDTRALLMRARARWDASRAYQKPEKVSPQNDR